MPAAGLFVAAGEHHRYGFSDMQGVEPERSLARQPDAIEALTQATVRRIHYREACELAARDFAVAMHLARQLVLDERHLHNWNLRLGRANAEERLAALLLELRNRLLLIGVR